MSMDAGVQLETSSDLLWRQIHPTFIQDGRVTSMAFRPTPKDQGRLSFVQEARGISAEEAYDYHTETLGFASSGVWAVTVGEVIEEAEYPVFDDSHLADLPGHAYADATAASRSEQKRRGTLLAELAVSRGCQFPL